MFSLRCITCIADILLGPSRCLQINIDIRNTFWWISLMLWSVDICRETGIVEEWSSGFNHTIDRPVHSPFCENVNVIVCALVYISIINYDEYF